MNYGHKKYYVYILTNYTKTVLYTGVTDNLEQRIIEHYIDRGSAKSFTGNIMYFIYFFMNLLFMSIIQ
ncbi:MAG: GIY-YIG nuclease family protein [Chitinophagaceae bacterium]